MTGNDPAAALEELRAHYLARIDDAVRRGKDKLVAELADEYAEEALLIMTDPAAAP